MLSCGNTAQQCRLALFQDSDFASDLEDSLELFQDSDFAGELEDSKSTSGRTLCIFGSRTFVPTSWMCKKQTSVSHSSTESEVISLDAGWRIDGIPALDLWDLVTRSITLFYQHTHAHTPTHQALGNQCRGEIRSTNPKTKLDTLMNASLLNSKLSCIFFLK